ncbi:MAG: hypothetical protein PWQ22_1471 [Archaeoglobaceae archaeon]|nr:hypothetical protein [Archaeoglobaceae archaeon]
MLPLPSTMDFVSSVVFLVILLGLSVAVGFMSKKRAKLSTRGLLVAEILALLSPVWR